MEISNNSQALNQLQASIQPVRPQEPKYTDGEVYKASQGNIHRNGQGELAITPQGETNINNRQSDAAAQSAAETQANKDSQRESAVDVLARKSNQSQVEIYLAVATDGNYSPVENETASIIESLRDVQKQNNAVEAYATYQTNQNAPVNNLARGLAG
ncbi:MAG: hypothetical protein Q9M32_02795 [Sulfurimonas sp.]|nr:hypothetical protein [Sulfurimonas sp.]MDQ7060464.1 hypothetical protein [Sulfurimonas sp.]